MPQMRLPYRKPISVHFRLNLQFFSKYPAMGITLYCWSVMA